MRLTPRAGRLEIAEVNASLVGCKRLRSEEHGAVCHGSTSGWEDFRASSRFGSKSQAVVNPERDTAGRSTSRSSVFCSMRQARCSQSRRHL